MRPRASRALLNYARCSEKKGEEDQYRSDGSHRDPAYTYNLDWFQPECWAVDSQYFGVSLVNI